MDRVIVCKTLSVKDESAAKWGHDDGIRVSECFVQSSIRTNDLIAWRMRIDYESRPFNQQYQQMKRHNRINIDISYGRRVFPAMQYVSISIPDSNNTISIYESGEGWCDTRVTSEARGAANKRENKNSQKLAV